jgi:ribosomal protein L10
MNQFKKINKGLEIKHFFPNNKVIFFFHYTDFTSQELIKFKLLQKKQNFNVKILKKKIFNKINCSNIFKSTVLILYGNSFNVKFLDLDKKIDKLTLLGVLLENKLYLASTFKKFFFQKSYNDLEKIIKKQYNFNKTLYKISFIFKKILKLKKY